MPWLARRSNDCCCVSARVKDFKPRNMIGWYAMTMEELNAIASSATALVRSMVRRAVFDWRRDGSNGASSSSPVLSQELSASSFGYLRVCQYCKYIMRYIEQRTSHPQSTYSFCIALTTALEKGAEVVVALIANRRAGGTNIQLLRLQSQSQNPRVQQCQSHAPATPAVMRHSPSPPKIPVFPHSATASYQIRR